MKASDVQQEIDRMTQNRTTIMNEKLTQIAKQAQVEHCISHVRLQEFAELIVHECIDYCGENLSKTVGGALKIHFGVEE